MMFKYVGLRPPGKALCGMKKMVLVALIFEFFKPLERWATSFGVRLNPMFLRGKIVDQLAEGLCFSHD